MFVPSMPALAPTLPPTGDVLASLVTDVLDELSAHFRMDFSIFDGRTGQLLHQGGDGPPEDDALRAELIRTVANSKSPEFIGDEDPVLLLALPIVTAHEISLVAVGAFVTRRANDGEDLSGPAILLGRGETEMAEWIGWQPEWDADALTRMAGVVAAKFAADATVEQLQGEVETLSGNLASTYEEISLLYSLTQNLRISSSDHQLGQMALDWLLAVLPAAGMAIQYLTLDSDDGISEQARSTPTFLTGGECPVDHDRFAELVRSLKLDKSSGPLVQNQRITQEASWKFPEVRELIVVPLAEGENLVGWLAAFNHTDGQEFGTVEANLLSSVGAILGIHSGNIELYRQQAEFLTSVVRALTSAIDAKDPYTCGHSDRVARIAVRIGRELGFEGPALKTLYMTGLLHDIGKIGIDDNVLRKPGRLTEAEYEHIKLHPELGHKILKDLRNLNDVLPTVLHHHEHWDGDGYPGRLRGEEIPLQARVAAVADAYDAMTSDRPYRKGMPEQKVEEIFRKGAGKQWDAQVIETYFRVRDDIREISRRERESINFDLHQWA